MWGGTGEMAGAKIGSVGNSLPCTWYSQGLCKSCAAVRRRSGRLWRRDSRMSLASPSRVSHFLLLSRGLSVIAPACRRTSSGEAYACWQHCFCPGCKLQPCSEAFRAGARDSIKHSRHLHLQTRNMTLHGKQIDTEHRPHACLERAAVTRIGNRSADGFLPSSKSKWSSPQSMK